MKASIRRGLPHFLIKRLVHESYKTRFSRVACVVGRFYRTRSSPLTRVILCANPKQRSSPALLFSDNIRSILFLASLALPKPSVLQCIGMVEEEPNVKRVGFFFRKMLTLVLCVDLYFFNIFFRSVTFLFSSVSRFSSFRSLLRNLSSSANSCLFLATFSCSRLDESVKANPSPVLQSEAMMRKRV